MFKKTATLFTTFTEHFTYTNPNFSVEVLTKTRSAIEEVAQKIAAGNWRIPEVSLEVLKKTHSAIEEAAQKIGAGDWRSAQDLLKSTIENYIEKNDINNEESLIRQAYFLHGLASELRGRKYHEEALKSFQKVLKINPEDIEAKQHIESIKCGRLEFPPGIKVKWIEGSDQPIQDDELEKTPGN